MENRFNLIDEPWIPVAGRGRASLKDIFSHPEYSGLGGNPVQKIALMKLLLAIAQAAATPADETAWRELGWPGLAARCLDYLGRWHDRFYLYGDQPFLQMPGIKAAATKSYGALMPQIATGNTSVLTEIQMEHLLDDAERAGLLISLMGFALGGKKTDNSITLTAGYAGKKPTAKPGPSLEYMGLLHNFLLGESLLQSLWLNLLTAETIAESRSFSAGLGSPPWEQMPLGESDPIAETLKNSLQGRLIPLCRFCLLTDSGLHYSEGLNHAGYKEGRMDPTVAINYSLNQPKAVWARPERRPWRELTSLLAFISHTASSQASCLQLKVGISRIDKAVDSFAIWSGGLRVSSNAGEQYVSGSDDFVESVVWLKTGCLSDIWFNQLQLEMTGLDDLSKTVYGCVLGYFKEQKMEQDVNKIAGQAGNLFWQLCERDFQALVDACDPTAATARQALRRRFAGYARDIYDRFCPQETARQLEAWVSCRPNPGKYLKQEAGCP